MPHRPVPTREQLALAADHLEQLAKQIRELDDPSQLGTLDIGYDLTYADPWRGLAETELPPKIWAETLKIEIEWVVGRAAPLVAP